MLHQDSNDRPVWLMLGSANFTRRNLDNYNLEIQVALQTDLEHPAAQRALAFFDQPKATTSSSLLNSIHYRGQSLFSGQSINMAEKLMIFLASRRFFLQCEVALSPNRDLRATLGGGHVR